MTYRLVFAPIALEHLEHWRKSGQKKALSKIETLLGEMQIHPYTGTGQVEQLKGANGTHWSRRIDKKSRIIYRVFEDKVIVEVVSMLGHYDDK